MVKLLFRISGAQPAPGLDPGLCSLCCDPESLDWRCRWSHSDCNLIIGVYHDIKSFQWLFQWGRWWTIKFGVASTTSSWDWLGGTAGTPQNNLLGVPESKLVPVLGLLNSWGLNRGSTNQHTSTMYWEQCTEYWYKYYWGGERFSEWDPSER